MNDFKMNRLDQCRIGMCQQDWSIYIDALKIMLDKDQKVEPGLKSEVKSEVQAGQQSSASTKKNHKKNENVHGDAQKNLLLEIVGGERLEVERSEIDGIESLVSLIPHVETDKKLQLTRFTVSDFYKVGAHGFFRRNKIAI